MLEHLQSDTILAIDGTATEHWEDIVASCRNRIEELERRLGEQG